MLRDHGGSSWKFKWRRVDSSSDVEKHDRLLRDHFFIPITYGNQDIGMETTIWIPNKALIVYC